MQMKCKTCDWSVKNDRLKFMAMDEINYCPSCGEYLIHNRPDIQ